MKNADYYMARCETLASGAATKGNSPVGSLIVVEDQIIVEAEEAVSTKQDVSCHAEMEVIREAAKVLGKDMSNAVLYTTKEPCVMCSYAIRFHKIRTVVFKEKSGDLGGAHGSFNLLTAENVPKSWGSPVQCIHLENNK